MICFVACIGVWFFIFLRTRGLATSIIYWACRVAMGLALLQIIIIIFFLLESRTNIYIYIYNLRVFLIL